MIQMNGPASSIPPGSPGGPAPTFRLGKLQAAAPILCGLLVGTALVYVVLEATGERMTAGELWSCLSAAVIASVVVPALPPNYGIELTHNRLVLLGNRRREIEWREITGLEIRKTAGIRTIVASVTDGRRIPLRAPMSLLDRNFDHKAQTLTNWWAARRGGPDGV
ncbi:hypothetical protein RB628_19940 [Streptomyces sp. ADMS]|uniref:hypothetical protein n=1 Tax=Streptomyces sp. ADMS TaxID=3071415 RepID=UPI00296E2DBC|nr:hypothetical protein [Streptomyces sp. ADMS]MDW4907556.1 hypothetical protein [Streptomyces sp. ADMS]